MGFFSDLLSRIERHADAAAPTAACTTGTPADTSASAAPAAPASSAPAVDRTAVLNGLAATHTETLDWQHSIVDLLKLVGMDSSLTARKEQATDKPRQNIVYLSAELNRLCRIRVSTDISIRNLSPVSGLILSLYSVVAHRNATSRVQSI